MFVKVSKKPLVEILNSDISFLKGSIKNSLKLNENDFELFHIQEVTFEEDAPRREALENVLGSLRLKDINFIYLIMGSKDGISFYFGVAKNKKNPEIDVDDIAKQILQSNIEANFRGSKIERLKKEEKIKLRQKLKKFSKIAEINGVPDINEKAEKFQGIDRLVDIMLKDEFALMIIASALSLDEIENIEKELFKIYDKIVPFVKKSIQETTSKSKSSTETDSKTTSKTNSHTTSATNSNSTSESESNSTSISTQKSTTNTSSSKSTSNSSIETKSNSTQKTKSESNSDSASETKSETTSKNSALTYSDNTTENKTINVEFEKKELEEWLKYIDEVLLKRVNYAKGKGAFVSGVYLFANTKGKITKLGNSFISLFSGVEENKLPLQYEKVKDLKHKEAIYNFQLPQYSLNLDTNQYQKMILFSKINGLEWFSTKELSIIASLPQKEVVGLRLKEEVEFGLNVPQNKGIHLGKLVRSGQKLDIDVNLKIEDLNKHIFIAGVTGSGKTTTCQSILYRSNLPFLVIEPAKTEYRILTECDDVLVFTLGNENIAPFRLNPFEFFEGENISSRVDMIKAAIESSFDMEAAIPQIIETAIYRAYEKYGWDIGLNQNFKFDNPFSEGVNAFPMLEDVIEEVENVVNEQNFAERLRLDYIASIKARLQGLMVGAKKYMLNTPRSYDFRELLKKKVILELEEIKNPNEKSFIMGLILVNLNEALKSIYKKDKTFRHITLIEEAHRLLSKYEPGDSLNKKNGIESFTDMLAEVRKYGESLIIVDQIPNKLTSEILKNTNTKIVHRLFAADDKEAIGNTMALEEEQKEFLSKLEIGRAVVFNQSFYNALQVQITPIENISTTSEKEVSEKKLRDIYLSYYAKINNLNLTKEDVDILSKLELIWLNFLREAEKREETELYKKYYSQIRFLLSKFSADLEIVAEFLVNKFYFDEEEKVEIIKEVLKTIKNNDKLGLLLRKIRR
jgi:DNA helicase HerA-like ATPase